ncbi:hypothetical protein SDC9_179927 [bioreactor metagenome]|uniref:Uncharacterized protein n=1 Tax=bioreactor metagenome TaxID=1076179 RepID=A0A645H372_9ZZZZ
MAKTYNPIPTFGIFSCFLDAFIRFITLLLHMVINPLIAIIINININIKLADIKAFILIPLATFISKPDSFIITT